MPSRFNWEAWLFIFPALALLLVFLVWPTAQTVYLSLHKGSILDTTRDFVGLAHYERLLTGDRLFLRLDRWPPSGAVVNTVVWLVLFPTVTVAIGLVVAVLADGKRYEPIVKSIVFVPMAISATAASVIFRFVYSTDPNIGAINAGPGRAVAGLRARAVAGGQGHREPGRDRRRGVDLDRPGHDHPVGRLQGHSPRDPGGRPRSTARTGGRGSGPSPCRC